MGDFDPSQALFAIKKATNYQPQRKTPLLAENIVVIYDVVNFANDYEFLHFAAILLMFRCLLRVSHVIKSPHTLLREDIIFTPWGMLVNISSSKTKQIKSGDLLPVALSNNYKLCAVSVIKMLLSRYPLQDSDYLFSTNDIEYLSYSHFSGYFKLLTSRASLSGNYASHSCRRGGTTHMHLQGCSTVDIKTRGRWKSDCFLDYIDPPLQASIAKERAYAQRL